MRITNMQSPRVFEYYNLKQIFGGAYFQTSDQDDNSVGVNLMPKDETDGT
jgi:hypothetical protein